jgi:hypothetical protein
MLLTACVILSVFWLLGILNSYTFGAYMHILLGIPNSGDGDAAHSTPERFGAPKATI